MKPINKMTLEELYEACRKLQPPTPEQEREARISWVYGNLACSTNHKVSREDVENAVDKVFAEKCLACGTHPSDETLSGLCRACDLHGIRQQFPHD